MVLKMRLANRRSGLEMDHGGRDKTQFDLQGTLRAVLSENSDVPIFDRLLRRFEAYSDRKVSNLNELRHRDNKCVKGLAWEEFCKWYMLTVQGYREVWLWSEIPEDIRIQLKLKSRVDNGIDIVARRNPETGWVAVQCKYRKKVMQKVTWTCLSTFVGLCAVTGPWDAHIVMTNCSGVTRKVPRGEKDKTIAYGTFKKLDRGDCTSKDEVQVVGGINAPRSVKTSEEIRAARLARFG